MDKFDEKIIGYESTKNILRQILDTLKRPEIYKSKGASIPRGLLMESDPGLGKKFAGNRLYKRIRPQVLCLSENQSGKQFSG